MQVCSGMVLSAKTKAVSMTAVLLCGLQTPCQASTDSRAAASKELGAVTLTQEGPDGNLLVAQADA